MRQEWHKAAAAAAALAVVKRLLAPGSVLGVGTGSTTNYFIDGLPALRDQFAGAVASSEATRARLQENSIPVLSLNDVEAVAVYVDGADEATPERVLVKGGGGALTREKIVAASAAHFICIVDDTKLVATLGAFPLPVEILPLARRLVVRHLRALGGAPAFRAGFTTDNGNHILDVRGLPLDDPQALVRAINTIPGVVDNGLFAGGDRPDVILAAADRAIQPIVAEDCEPALRAALAALD